MSDILSYRSKLNSKNVQQFLTHIYGISYSNSKQICDYLGLNLYTKVSQLSEFKIRQILFVIENKFETEIKLKHQVITSIKHLIEIYCFKGSRHKLRLPVRGQNTHNNAKTIKKLSIFPK